MLALAQTHERVTYILQEVGLHLQLPVRRVDIVSFAGSLSYTKTESLRDALAKLCRSGGTIVVYDFGVHLHEVLNAMGVDCVAGAADYDYRANLSDWQEYEMEVSDTERLAIDASEEQIAHLLLADSNHYDALQKRFPDGDLFESIVTHLGRRSQKPEVHADVYFTRYRMQGSIEPVDGSPTVVA